MCYFRFAQAVLAGTTTLLLSGIAAAQVQTPNIVMIFTDDQGWNDVSCYGSEIPTPNIDSLAKEGLKFTQFYAASSICTPSRFGLFTGCYSVRSEDQLNGALMFLDDQDAVRGIDAKESTYVRLLKEAGYQTALVGKWHLGHGNRKFWPTEHGFDSFYGHTGGCIDFFTLDYGTHPDWYRDHKLVRPGTYATDAITDEAIGFLNKQSSDSPPFYLHIAYNAPHFGKVGDGATGKAINRMQPKEDDLARVDKSITNPDRRAFAAKVIGMDDSIGKLLRELKVQGLEKDTLVIFMTDHGGDPKYGGSNLPLRGGKATLFEGGIRVPCIIRWPGRVAANTTTDIVSCGVDCFPTLCAIAGINTSHMNLDGVNILPLLQESAEAEQANNARELFWYTGAHRVLDRSNWTALRSGDLKYVKPPGKTAMLFDLRQDPNESIDLATQRPHDLERLANRAQKILGQ